MGRIGTRKDRVSPDGGYFQLTILIGIKRPLGVHVQGDYFRAWLVSGTETSPNRRCSRSLIRVTICFLWQLKKRLLIRFCSPRSYSSPRRRLCASPAPTGALLYLTRKRTGFQHHEHRHRERACVAQADDQGEGAL